MNLVKVATAIAAKPDHPYWQELESQMVDQSIRAAAERARIAKRVHDRFAVVGGVKIDYPGLLRLSEEAREDAERQSRAHGDFTESMIEDCNRATDRAEEWMGIAAEIGRKLAFNDANWPTLCLWCFAIGMFVGYLAGGWAR